MNLDGIDGVVVYLGKPPIDSSEYGIFVELARKVKGKLIIDPVEKSLLIGENDGLLIKLNSDFKKGIEEIIKTVPIEGIYVKKGIKEKFINYSDNGFTLHD